MSAALPWLLLALALLACLALGLRLRALRGELASHGAQADARTREREAQVREQAAMQEREYVVPDDVKFLVRPVYRHRIILRPEAEIEGLTPDTAMARVLAKVEVPR